MSNKLKTKNKIVDMINDMKLKEDFADEAIAILLNHKLIKPRNLKNITVEYGFLYKFGKRGYNSLFKVITRNKTFYFGVTGYELSLICFTEDLFVKTANDFLQRQGKNYDYTQQNNIIAIGVGENMLNIEKYKDKLIELGVIDINKLAIKDGVPYRCNGVSCDDCDFKNSENGCYIYGCSEWLFSEYEEPEVDWSKVKVDTPILVGNTENNVTHKRYFAKYEDGKVYTWGGGTTSWTVSGEYDVTFWKYAKLAESEE